ncbi:MAG TPA: molybdate ABC transporter substrate-binding protein [Verrucomicrobiae bacterium]
MNDRILSTNPVLARRAGISRAAVILTATLLLTTSLHAGQITVAAAADLKFALDELTAEFHTNQPGISVKVTYGSSGSFYTQLQNQAPFDIFFSADVAYPRKLVAAGLALDTNVFLYAVGRIVVWVPKASPVDIEKLGIQSLFAPSVQKIAIANPKHAPYGVAAMAAMKSLGVYDQAEPKLVFGENVAQTVQFVESGAADIGVIALSLAVAPQMRDSGRYWEIPLNAYPKMEQGGIIMNWTKEAEAARAFRDFVLGQHGRAVLKRNGFFLPEKLEK